MSTTALAGETTMIPSNAVWIWVGLLVMMGSVLGWAAVCDRSFRSRTALINMIFGAMLIFTAFAAPDDMASMLALIGLIVACELVAGVITAVVLRHQRRPTESHVAASTANCGCWYHAEQGIPCEHDLALAKSQRGNSG